MATRTNMKPIEREMLKWLSDCLAKPKVNYTQIQLVLAAYFADHAEISRQTQTIAFHMMETSLRVRFDLDSLPEILGSYTIV